MREITSLIAVTIAALLFFGVNGYGGDNEIYGCYQKHGGDLRIVKHPKACRHSEIPISWNKLGLQGPAGPPGPQGPQGSQGLQGLPGTLSQGGDYPKVYDANSKFLGIFPSAWDGYLSFYIQDLSRFISLSPYSGDVDPGYLAVPVYYREPGCNGDSFLDAGMRHQIMKFESEVESKYITAMDMGENVRCEYVKSVSRWKFNGIKMARQCLADVMVPECNLLPSMNVTLPFDLPAALPIQVK